MSIEVKCDCGRVYVVGDDKAGLHFRCKSCDSIVEVLREDADAGSGLGPGGSDNPFAAPGVPAARVRNSLPPDVPQLPLGLGWWAYAWMRGFDFESRARRREYWFFQLYNAVINVGITLLLTGVGLAASVDEVTIELVDNVISGIFGLAALIPGIAVAIRRLHDIGKSGWWLLLYLLCVIGAIILLIWDFTDSQEEPNEWGPSPKYSA